MNAKDLSPEQLKQLKQWAADGLELGEIQKRLGDEFEIRGTFLDTRFLLADLGIELAEDEEEEEPEPEETAPPTGADPAEATSAPETGGIPDETASPAENPFAKKEEGGGETTSSNVSVTVDQVAVPGTMVSGRVTFSDGKGAAWYIDQTGSLGLNPDEEGHKPSEADVKGFQKELETALKNAGF